MDLTEAWDIIKHYGTRFPDTAQERLDVKMTPHFNLDTNQFINWAKDAGWVLTISEANEILSDFPKHSRGNKVCSNTDPSVPWLWSINDIPS